MDKVVNDNVKVYVQHGGADSDEFWDVGLDDAQLAHAGVEGEDRRGFSMHVDPDTGEVSLNAGYEPGSTPHREETAMFDEFRDSAVEELLSFAKARGIIPAFVAMAEGEADERRERLVDLSADLDEEQEADDEADEDPSCAMGLHSWVDKVGLLPASTKCTRCGEPYGNPD